MTVNDLDSLKQKFQEINTPIFGAGVYAFDRLGLENIAKNYQLLALRYSLDTKLIEKDIPLLSLEKGMGTKHIKEPRNATTVLGHLKTVKHLKKFKRPIIYVHKASSKMEAIARKYDWQLMANPTDFGKKLFENKINFRKILNRLDIPATPGKTSAIGKLHYGHLINKFGSPFVIQHPTRGGGKGTFFIKSQENFQNAVAKLNSKWNETDEKKLNPPEEAIISRYINGPSPSVTACVTREGILSSNLQHQILDIPDLYHPSKGSGLFCGHDWTASDFAEKLERQANEYTQKIGKYFQAQGYIGIFGLDFVLDSKKEQLYLTECNPRMLGSYPVFNMAQLLNNEPPLLGFHALEFLKADYRPDLEKINLKIREKKTGAQMILHNLTEKWARNQNQVKAGIYKLKQNRLHYLRRGYDLKHLKAPEEFLLADGVPLKKSHFSPNRRLCRILTLKQCYSPQDRKLTDWANQVAKSTYAKFNLKPIRWVKLKKFFAPNFLAKG